jgi:hypothetical protein
MRHALLLAMLLMGCKGRSGGGSASPPPGEKKDAGAAAVASKPVDMARAKVTLGCLFDKARAPREILTVLAEEAPAPTVRLAALEAIDRARVDGESPAIGVIADAIEALSLIDDLDGLRAAFALADAIPGARDDMRFTHSGPARARVGLPVTKGDISAEPAATVRETALAANLPAAQKLFAALSTDAKEGAYNVENYIGALAALGKTAEVRAVIAKTKEEDRLKYAGLWLLTSIRGGAKLAEPLAEVKAQLATATERGVLWFQERVIFRRAARAKRGAELAGLYRDLKARYTKDKGPKAPVEVEYDLAVAVGDVAEIKALAAEPDLARRVAVHTGPFDAALAMVIASKYPQDDLVRLWARSISDGADAAWGDKLAAAACPPAKPPRRPATAAVKGLKLTVTEKAKKPKFECQLHDLAIRLTDGTKTLGEEILEGECSGPCTAAEQREGRAHLAEIEAQIERGEASNSQTDYNFTECMFSGPSAGRIDRVGDREVAIISDHYIGAHDVDKDRYQLALEVCGALHVTETFGGRYGGSWALAELSLRESADKQMIIVDGKSDRWRGVVFRLRLPECPGTPDEEAIETE